MDNLNIADYLVGAKRTADLYASILLSSWMMPTELWNW